MRFGRRMSRTRVVLGDDYGFVVLDRGGLRRRIPYAFSVTRPKLAGAQAIQLKAVQSGTTADGVDRVEAYRWPANPFSVNSSVFGLDKPVADDGKEKVYYVDIAKTATNVGVAITNPAPNLGSRIEDLLTPDIIA